MRGAIQKELSNAVFIPIRMLCCNRRHIPSQPSLSKVDCAHRRDYLSQGTLVPPLLFHLAAELNLEWHERTVSVMTAKIAEA